MKVVEELPATSHHRITAQLNYAEASILLASKSKSIKCNESIEILESICLVVQDVINTMVENFIQSGGRDHSESDIYPAFYSYAKQMCLMLLSQAHQCLGNNKKSQDNANEAIEWGRKTGISSQEETQDLMELAGLNLSDGRGNNAQSGVRVLKEFYESAVGRRGKDHPDAIKAAAVVGDACADQMKGKEALPWYLCLI
jgi:predicted lactoylglutathione lyase